MSTRCCIAKRYGESWRGRYVHCDGYPTGVGTALHQAVRQLGYEAACKLLIADEKVGWSVIYGKNIDFTMPPCWPYTGEPQGPISYSARGETEELLLTPKDASEVEWIYIMDDRGVEVLYSDPEGRGICSCEVVHWDDPFYFPKMASIEEEVQSR